MTYYNELVRCGECKFWSETEKGFGRCLKSGFKTPKDFLGEDGERKDQGMTDYSKLVEALRCELHYTSCQETDCTYICHDTFCDTYRLMIDAAAAIEALRFELDCVNDSIKQLALPVDGEWVRVEDGDSWHYECSRCRERPLYSLYGDIVLSGTCHFCGAKMEVQE